MMDRLHKQKFATFLINVPLDTTRTHLPIWCKSNYEHLVINLSYHTCIHNTLEDTITIIILKNGTHV